MNWINIHTDTLRSEAYISAEPVERATWLNLLGWCCSQENGGVIEEAGKWTDRKWQQVCGVTKEEATLVSTLYRFDDNGNLVVELYPEAMEQQVIAKRETAKINGRKGGRPKGSKSKKTDVGSNVGTNIGTNVANRKGRKGNEKEKEKEVNGKIVAFAPDHYQSRLNALFRRRESTQWSDKEIKAYKKIDFTGEDMALVEKFHATPGTYHRQGLQTLLNNWLEEVDKARNYKPDHNPSNNHQFKTTHAEQNGF